MGLLAHQRGEWSPPRRSRGGNAFRESVRAKRRTAIRRRFHGRKCPVVGWSLGICEHDYTSKQNCESGVSASSPSRLKTVSDQREAKQKEKAMRKFMLAFAAGAVLTFAADTVEAGRYGYGNGRGRSSFSSGYRGGSFNRRSYSGSRSYSRSGFGRSSSFYGRSYSPSFYRGSYGRGFGGISRYSGFRFY